MHDDDEQIKIAKNKKILANNRDLDRYLIKNAEALFENNNINKLNAEIRKRESRS
jgi:hypothetical protein